MTGSIYKGQFPSRAFEPLVMYHFVERDLENCLAKLRRAKKVRKGGWRDQAGEEGCKKCVFSRIFLPFCLSSPRLLLSY
jgi:hypothetical protein